MKRDFFDLLNSSAQFLILWIGFIFAIHTLFYSSIHQANASSSLADEDPGDSSDILENNTISINCSDLDDPVNSCTMTPNIASFSNLLFTLKSIEECKTNAESSTASCTTDVGETFTCTDVTDSSASCQFPGNTLIHCSNITQKVAECTVEVPPQTSVDQALQSISQTAPPQAEIARVIGKICTQRNVAHGLQRDCNALIDSALFGNEQAQQALAAITPIAASAPLDASQTNIKAQNNNIQARLQTLKSSYLAAPTGNRLSFSLTDQFYATTDFYQDDDPRDRFNDNGSSNNTVTEIDFGELGLFVNGTINRGNKDQTDNEAGFDFNAIDITLGADYRYSRQLFVGLAYGYSYSKTTLQSRRGQLDATSYHLILYSRFFPSSSFHIDSSVSLGGQNFNQKRHIRYTLQNRTPATEVNQSAAAEYFGGQISASLAAGYEFTLGGMSIEPFMQWNYIKTKIDDYTENMSEPDQPGSGWGITVNQQNDQSLSLSLGGQLAYAISSAYGVWLPQLRFEWLKELKDNIHVVEGYFIGDPSQETFRLPTDKPDTSYFNLGVGISAVFANGRSAYLFYQTILGYEHLSQQAINIGLRWEI